MSLGSILSNLLTGKSMPKASHFQLLILLCNGHVRANNSYNPYCVTEVQQHLWLLDASTVTSALTAQNIFTQEKSKAALLLSKSWF